ncbi:CLUMA_CG010372, isoform A [Clunio marinus]|uniref:CLUMA_CG010372, isoform A n=1 Tax=Clunio marinus TaxID=568069 RepID=A0A1J1IB29_9DIPT|nr:CLUMA_CG010372, isoform A [Clunio marinus]
MFGSRIEQEMSGKVPERNCLSKRKEDFLSHKKVKRVQIELGTYSDVQNVLAKCFRVKLCQVGYIRNLF